MGGHVSVRAASALRGGLGERCGDARVGPWAVRCLYTLADGRCGTAGPRQVYLHWWVGGPRCALRYMRHAAWDMRHAALPLGLRAINGARVFHHGCHRWIGLKGTLLLTAAGI